ncbi:MAG: tetratricopeptide repeat protein [Euryarchaeota archaeon]
MNKSSPTRTKQLKDILLVATYPLAFLLIIISILFYQYLVWPLGIFSLILLKMITESDQIMENNILWDTGLIFHKNKIEWIILVLIIWWLIIPALFMPYMGFNYIVLALALIIIVIISYKIMINLLGYWSLKPYHDVFSNTICDYTQSKAALQSLLEKNPEDIMAWAALTVPLSGLKEYDELNRAQNKALQGKLKTWPLIKKLQMSYFYSLLAISHENLKEYDLAQDYVDKALEYDDTGAMPLNLKGYILLKQQKIEEGAEYINKAFKLHVSQKELQLSKAYLFGKEGNYKRSHQIMDYILAHHPEYPYVYLRKGELLLEEGKLDEAKVYLNKFKMICPQDAELQEVVDKYAYRLDSN